MAYVSNVTIEHYIGSHIDGDSSRTINWITVQAHSSQVSQ